VLLVDDTEQNRYVLSRILARAGLEVEQCTTGKEALERVKMAARKHHVALGIFSSDGKAAVARVRQGFQMISVTTDVGSMIAAAAQNLRVAREERYD